MPPKNGGNLIFLVRRAPTVVGFVAHRFLFGIEAIYDVVDIGADFVCRLDVLPADAALEEVGADRSDACFCVNPLDVAAVVQADNRADDGVFADRDSWNDGDSGTDSGVFTDVNRFVVLHCSFTKFRVD